jgi:hypothetical protein
VPYKSWRLPHPDIDEAATGSDLGGEYLSLGARPPKPRQSGGRARIYGAAFLVAGAAIVVSATLTIPASRPVQPVSTASSAASTPDGPGVPARWDSSPTIRDAISATDGVAPVPTIARSVAPPTRTATAHQETR